MQSTAAHAVLAVVHRAAEGGYWAEVPSMPGCASQAESLASLRVHLLEAITGWVGDDAPIALAFSDVIDDAAVIPA